MWYSAGADSASYRSLRLRPASRAERFKLGRSLRERVPRGSLGVWKPPAGRPNPIDLIVRAHEGRLAHLIPIRIGRMVASPYGFLRGAAVVMAEDVARLPATGITPVICGDAHLGNFGFYASPERNLVIDLNDFDEAHPGAWEWDLRRLVASIWVAGRQNGSTESQCRDSVSSCVAAYRHEVQLLANEPLLSRSYQRLDVDRLHGRISEKSLRTRDRTCRKARPIEDERPGTAAVHDGARRATTNRGGATAHHACPRCRRTPDRCRPRRVSGHISASLATCARWLHAGRRRAQGCRRQQCWSTKLCRPVRGQQPR